MEQKSRSITFLTAGAILFLAVAVRAPAQEKKEAGETSKQGVNHKVDTSNVSTQDEPFVGPPAPVTRINKSASNRLAGQRTKPPRKPLEVPKPTVVLKPGEVPAIEFDTPVYDFGRVRSGTEISHDFWFTNTGNGPLEIVQAKPS